MRTSRKGPSGSPCSRVSWEEAWRMYKAGQITDSLSVIAILHEAVRRLEGD